MWSSNGAARCTVYSNFSTIPEARASSLHESVKEDDLNFIFIYAQVFEPIDMLHLIGKDPLNDFQGGATYYVATADSGQGAPSVPR